MPEYDRALHEFRRWIRNPTVDTKITCALSSTKWLGFFWGLRLLNAVITATYAEPDPTKPATVVFVCPHGSVKSQVMLPLFCLSRLCAHNGIAQTSSCR